MNRRTFVKNSGLALSSIPLMSSIAIRPFKSRQKLGVCLVGLGRYSLRLASALQLTEHCYLAGIATGSPEKIPIWQEKHSIPDPNVYDYSNLHLIANNDEIDIVYIVLPTGLHSLYARIAANAGKHVWCEKPMAMSTTECQAIIDSCTKNKVKLSIGYRMHHEPNTQQLIEWVKAKKYGNTKHISAQIGYNMVPDPSTWRMSAVLGGGFLYDLGIYSLNAIRYAAQEEPTHVTAHHHTVRTELFTEVPEVTNFTFDFASGLSATGKSTARENIHTLDVQAKNGWINLNPFSKYDGITINTSDGYTATDQIPNQQAQQMDNDALAIKNKQEVLVPGIEGIKDIRILEAINASAQSGQAVKI